MTVTGDGRMPSTPTVDGLIVGFAFAGRYGIFKCRQLGFTIRALDAREGIGSTR